MPLRITTVTGETYMIEVPAGDNERARLKEILHGGGLWLEVTPDSWVKRDAIVKIDLVDPPRTTGFS
jgi:hypothetical protein